MYLFVTFCCTIFFYCDDVKECLNLFVIFSLKEILVLILFRNKTHSTVYNNTLTAYFNKVRILRIFHYTNTLISFFKYISFLKDLSRFRHSRTLKIRLYNSKGNFFCFGFKWSMMRFYTFYCVNLFLFYKNPDYFNIFWIHKIILSYITKYIYIYIFSIKPSIFNVPFESIFMEKIVKYFFKVRM